MFSIFQIYEQKRRPARAAYFLRIKHRLAAVTRILDEVLVNRGGTGDTRRSDIRGEFIEITTVKTADSLSIELNGATREILDKYARRELPGGLSS